jgi:hypothetical protein
MKSEAEPASLRKKISKQNHSLAGCFFGGLVRSSKYIAAGCGGLVIPLWPFLNEPHVDSLGRDPDSAGRAINNHPNLLEIRPKLSVGNAGNLSADTAEIFGLTTPGNALAAYRSLSGKKTYSGHLIYSFIKEHKCLSRKCTSALNIFICAKIARTKRSFIIEITLCHKFETRGS